MEEQFIPLFTWIIIGITALTSVLAFQNEGIRDKLIFHAPSAARGEWHRFVTSGLIHADLFHFIFNMYALYGFGSYLEYRFTDIFHEYGRLMFLLLYVAALVVSELPTYQRHLHDQHYYSLGASGAVAAVIFACIVLAPTMPISIFIVRNIPGFIFGIIYLGISSYFDKRGGGNINHSAHLWGAIFGIGFMLVAGPLAGEPVLTDFIYQVKHWADR